MNKNKNKMFKKDKDINKNPLEDIENSNIEENNNNNENEKIEEEDKKEENNNDIISKYEEKIKELEEENKKTKENLMLTLAELDNTRKRSNEEKEKTAKYAISKFAEDLIPVMENFYLAFGNENLDLSDTKTAENFFEGIKLTHNELKKVFDRNGLIRLFPLEEDFNPEFHNAIMQVESEGEEGKVVQVMQAGYKIKDRILRPALVGVSKNKVIK